MKQLEFKSIVRRCHRCEETKPLSEFHNESSRHLGKRYECKICTIKRTSAYQKLDHRREYNRSYKQRPEIRKRHAIIRLKTRYGLTPEQYESLLQKQNYRCALCDKQKKLHVDHCHKTGVVRGLLCAGCNGALGYLGDDPQRLQRAIAYVTPASNVVAMP